MSSIKMTFASLGIAALLAPSLAIASGGGTGTTGTTGTGAAGAAGTEKQISRADFERCNQQAMQVAGITDVGAPAASPGMTTPGTTGTQQDRPGAGAGTGAGQTGVGTGSPAASPGTGAAGVGMDKDKIDRAVQAYRDCLEQGKN